MMWVHVSLFYVFVLAIHGLDLQYCSDPLGMESGVIPDEAISASSSYVPNVGPKNGRLRVEKAGGAWCPKQQVERGIREYLQVNLEQVHVITGVQTQGRYDRGRGQEYTEEYTLEYWRPGFTDWREYQRWDGKKILRGNSDTASVESHRLMPPIFANRIRILPYSVHRRTVCLRVELLGCFYEDGVTSYTAPEASDPEKGLSDSSYDGQHSDGMLYGGLGRLVDGEIGTDNFRLDIGYGKGNGWVAWNNDTLKSNYIELIFEFDQIRNFSGVHLHTNNFFSRNVQVFSKAKLSFSIGGQYYNGKTLSFEYMPDRSLENARNVSIRLLHRIARFIKIRLFFADHWIMLSEVFFDSVPVSINVTEEDAPNTEENELVINLGKIIENLEETVAAKKDGDSYVEIIIGVLTAVMLLLLIVFVIILILSKRQKLQGSPTLFKNPFGVKINMKDLLMNLSTSNNPNTPIPSPVAPEPQPLTTSVSFEQYQSPLVGGHYYSTTEGVDDVPEVPPLPKSPSQGAIVGVGSPGHYRSLQGTPTGSPKLKMINLGSYFPSVGVEGGGRKRYSTAPREKHRIRPPVVYWNIAPSMDDCYCCREAELIPIPNYCLKNLENIGSCHAGSLSLYETEGLEDIIPGVDRVVLIRRVNQERLKLDAAAGSFEALREVRFLAGLSDLNICRVLGVVTAEQPPWMVIEYGDMGDLAQYLKFLANKSGTLRNPCGQSISTGSLLYMATQIASGMKYLESKHVVHKDLAARNCLVGRGYVIKIADVAMCKPQYNKDYVEIGGRNPAPIRWLPWESILLDKYTCSSSVWAFAVTLWEILGFACERPYYNLSNEKVIQNAEHMYYGGELQVFLNKPTLCSPDIYELMCQCWKRDDAVRPTFKQIYIFLKHVNKEFIPSD